MRLVSREVLALREVLEDGEEDLEEANHRSPDQGDSTSIGRAGIAAVFSYAQSARDTQNFHFVTSVNNSSDDLNVRLNYALAGTTVGRWCLHSRAATIQLGNVRGRFRRACWFCAIA